MKSSSRRLVHTTEMPNVARSCEVAEVCSCEFFGRTSLMPTPHDQHQFLIRFPLLNQ